MSFQVSGFAKSLLSRLSRVKTYGLDDADAMSGGHGGAGLAKVLNTFDLTLLGVGSTLGVGIYVLAGSVAKDIAGPAVCISFLIAAVASAFAALCYAEFGARVPRAGSAYIYSYVTVGEFIAFVIGWNLILEYLIGTASVARAFSANLDALTNYTMSSTFQDVFPIGGSFLAPYADFFALGITLALAVLLGFGIRSSAIFTNIFTFVNVFVVLFVVIAGAVNADGANWGLTEQNITELEPCADGTRDCYGTGGFLPFGFAGIMAGAAKCFFAFVGFDSIAATGEEAKNAKRAIPFSIILTLIIVFCAYFSVSVVITLMVPYYNQDPNTPLVTAFKLIGLEWAGWVVSIGSLFGLSASLLGAMIPLPRVIYAQAKDGLLFRPLAYIYPKFQTPLISTAVSGVLAAVLTAIFDLDSLVDMMSIGTLLAYTLVAVSVLILRYEHVDPRTVNFVPNSPPKWPWNRIPTQGSSKNAIYATAVYCALTVTLCGFMLGLSESSDLYWLLGIGIIVGAMVMIIGFLIFQPRSIVQLYFKVPGVPVVPCVSIFINTYLMFQLESKTWIQFGVWMAVGFLVYFGYGMWHSTEEYVQRGKPVPGSVQATGHTNKAFQDAENPPAIKSAVEDVPSASESDRVTLATSALDDVLDLHDDDQQLEDWIQNAHMTAERVFDSAREADQRKGEQEKMEMVIVSTMLERTHDKASKAFDKVRDEQEREAKESQEMMASMAANFDHLNDSLSKILEKKGQSEPAASDEQENSKNALFSELLAKVPAKENAEDVSGSRDADESPESERPRASPKTIVPSNPTSEKVLNELKSAFQKAAHPEEDADEVDSITPSLVSSRANDDSEPREAQ